MSDQSNPVRKRKTRSPGLVIHQELYCVILVNSAYNRRVRNAASASSIFEACRDLLRRPSLDPGFFDVTNKIRVLTDPLVDRISGELKATGVWTHPDLDGEVSLELVEFGK